MNYKNFLRYNMKCSRENVILREIFHVVSGLPLHIMLYCGNLDGFSNSVDMTQIQAAHITEGSDLYK